VAQPGEDLTPAPSDADHVRGSLNARVVITEFADFECPYCGDAYHVLEEIREKYGSEMALVFRHFPLSMHPHAAPAAEAAETAAGAGKFWEMYDRLFEHQNALSVRDLREYAEALGIEGDTVEHAIAERTYDKRIERDVRSGEASNVEGTPALFVNGFAYEDEVSVEALSEVIDRALAARPGVKV